VNELSLDVVLGFGVGAGIGAVLGYIMGTSKTLTKELSTMVSRIRVLDKPTDGNPYYIYLLKDDQSKILEVSVNPKSDWFSSMCQIGLEDRGLPYDSQGHGEGTFRIWWAKSPNAENYQGYWWAVEIWLGGAYPKACEIFEPTKNTWTNVLDYHPGGAWAVYKEVHPDGHIMS
jgi:hypothetical protein